MKKSLKSRCYPESQFGGFSEVDGTVRFFTRVRALMEPSFVMLDVGCGKAGFVMDPLRFRRDLRNFKGQCKRVIGIDVDPEASDNPLVDEFRLMEGDRWPLEDATVDLCLAHFVIEHAASPDAFFSECNRVLKPGGFLCLRTTNAWSYVGVAARLIPERWHPAVLHWLNPRRTEHAPTVFKCNTARKLRCAMRRHGFHTCVYPCAAEPDYLAFSKITYILGVLLHRMTPPMFRGNLCAFGRKLD